MQYEKIECPQNAFPTKFRFRRGEMVQNIRHQKQSGTKHRGINSFTMVFNLTLFYVIQGQNQDDSGQGIQRSVNGWQKAKINVCLNLNTPHHSYQQQYHKRNHVSYAVQFFLQSRIWCLCVMETRLLSGWRWGSKMAMCCTILSISLSLRHCNTVESALKYHKQQNIPLLHLHFQLSSTIHTRFQ